MKVSGKYLDNFQSRMYWAAKEGKSLHKMVNDKVVGTTDTTVLTDTTLYYDLVEGEIVFITGFGMALNTNSDTLTLELVSTTQAAGAGSATALSHHFHMATGAAATGAATTHYDIIPPLIVKYSDGARSVTARVTVNDNSAAVTIGWHGFREQE